MPKHGRIHLQRKVPQNIVLQGKHALETGDQLAPGLEIGIHVMPGALLVDRIGKALRSPFVYFNDFAALFLDELRNPVDQIPNLVFAQHAVDDIRDFVGIFRHVSLWTKSGPPRLRRAGSTPLSTPARAPSRRPRREKGIKMWDLISPKRKTVPARRANRRRAGPASGRTTCRCKDTSCDGSA